MNFGLADDRPDVFCKDLWEGLSGVCTQLLINGKAAVRLIDRPFRGDRCEESMTAFQQLRDLLVAAQWLPDSTPVLEWRGCETVVVPNPQAGYGELGRIVFPRIPLAAAILRAFAILRIRYQVRGTDRRPRAIVMAPRENADAVDNLYAIGDTFTERYPVHANLSRVDSDIFLELIGEPPPAVDGLPWSRAHYVRCRDASLLMAPLRQALKGLTRPLAAPRSLKAGEPVRVRVPKAAHGTIKGIAWLTDLEVLKETPEGDPPSAEPGECGEHWSYRPEHNGFVHAAVPQGSGPLVPVRVRAAQSALVAEPFEHESADRVRISLEGLGGVREIGANSYYYRFGRRGLLIDAGFDATREGWLGLPALERISRLDAIVLTHAHLDHVGAVPLLLAAFPAVRVYCTRATFALLGPTLASSASIAMSKFAETGEAPAYTEPMVKNLKSARFQFVKFGEKVAISKIPGLTLTFADAGHMIGSLYVAMAFQGATQETTIAHTGDINLLDLEVQTGMTLDGKSADHVVMEGTYGSRTDFGPQKRRDDTERFLAALTERMDAGGIVLAPAFSLGKAQEFVGLLNAWKRKTGKNVAIYTAGMASDINKLVRDQLTEFLPRFTAEASDSQRLQIGSLKKLGHEAWFESAAKVLAEKAASGPGVIVASHGMIFEDTNSYALARAILSSNDDRHAIFICGYLDPRTPGFRLREQAKAKREVIELGERDSVRRTIHSDRICSFSLTSHASFEELLDVAQSIPKKSLVLVHGESLGLDNLKNKVEELLASQGIAVRVPGFGERIEFGELDAPPNWDTEPIDEPTDATLAPGRQVYERRFIIKGLMPDRRTALIPSGTDRVTLELATERFAPERVRKVVLITRKGRTALFDGKSLDTSDGRFACDTLGKNELLLDVEEGGQITRTKLPFFVGQDLRLVESQVFADRPTAVIQVGGVVPPQMPVEIDGSTDCATQWNADTRQLLFEFKPNQAIGIRENIPVLIRWANGIEQRGPDLEGLRFDPSVTWRVLPARVGHAIHVDVPSSPSPIAVRVGGKCAQWVAGQLRFTPVEPGSLEVEFDYRGFDRTETRIVGAIDVEPAAELQLPEYSERVQTFKVGVTSIDAEFHGRELSLYLGERESGSWTAGPAVQEMSVSAGEVAGPLSAVVKDGDGVVLCRGTVEVLAGLTLDGRRSVPVTTADGMLTAEFAWLGLKDSDREVLASAFTAAGFGVDWRDNVLLATGNSATLGRRIVQLSGPDRVAHVWTLPNLEVQVNPAASLQVGQYVTVTLGGAPLDDDVPLTWAIDRIAPFMDTLSVNPRDGGFALSSPGRYAVALTGAGRRLRETTVDIAIPAPPQITEGGPLRQWHERGMDAVLDRLETLSPAGVVLALSQPGDPFLLVQGSASELVEIGDDGLRERCQAGDRVLVTWPGPTMPPLAGALLTRLRQRIPDLAMAQLGYPAPREVAADLADARRRQRHRVKCCIAANTRIDAGDSFTCPHCSGRPILRTDQRSVWIACPDCAFTDRATILTLEGLKRTDVRVLFAQSRMATYLTNGRGRRQYGGAFANSVLCATCHRPQPAYSSTSPWDRAELDRLLAAVAASWVADDREATVRRAVSRIAVRNYRRKVDRIRLENDIHTLIDADVIVDGRPIPGAERLTRGKSLCCDAPLTTWRRPIIRLFVGVEQLLESESVRRLGVKTGRSGLRALLSIVE